MVKLWFRNSNGDERVIAECETRQEVNKSIDQFIDDCNKKNPNRKPFKSYYTRSWVEDGRTIFDVGSWSEFFVWDKDEFGESKRCY
jgi:hypothetical protein